MDSAPDIREWNVDIDNSDKILTVKPEGISEEEIIAIIKGKGFKAEALRA